MPKECRGIWGWFTGAGNEFMELMVTQQYLCEVSGYVCLACRVGRRRLSWCFNSMDGFQVAFYSENYFLRR